MKLVNALVVDDSAIIRKIIRTNLARFEITNCDEAADGAAALKLLQVNDYHIIFTDYNMPGMNGLEFVKKLHLYGEKYAKIRIIAVSSEFNDTLRIQFQNLGVDHFIAKPFSLEMFKEAIAPILTGDDAQKETTSLSLNDISRLFQNTSPEATFDGKYLVLDFGKDKLTIDANAIAKVATVYSESEEINQ